MNTTSLISPVLYLPNTLIFSKIVTHNLIFIEKHEHYQKQTIRNRTHILTSNGIQTLTIPVKTHISKQIADIEIDNSQLWNQIHLKAIKTAYGKSAFFEYYFYQFEKIYISPKKYLFDFNIDLMTLCLQLLKVKKEINFTENYQIDYDNSFLDGRKEFFQSNYFPNSLPKPANKYYQLFGNEFANNISILDLLFNEGTNAINYLYNLS